MKPIVYMVATSVVSWFAVATIVDRMTAVEVLFGMLGPLAVTSATWAFVSWAYRERRQALTGLMAGAFFLKMVFFGGYVAAMLRVMDFRVVPFVVSFTCYFIGLYLTEALYMRRLFSERSK